MKKRWIVAIGFASLVGGVCAIAACSNEEEGEICDINNGNDDCDTNNNLACYPANQLNNVISDRCCPVNRQLATHPACVIPINVVGTDAQAPADTGPPPTVTSDASVSTDAFAPASDQ